MNPEEIQKIIKTTIENKIEYYGVYLLISILIILGATFLITYFNEKGKNYATKEDIAGITRRIEDVKAEIQNHQEIEKQKRQLKYDAVINTLTLIDANFSHKLIQPNGETPKKQFATIEEARRCHNSLILTCENTEIIEMFTLILFGPKDKNEKELPPTDLLNKFRNLVRKELGFGTEIPLDRDWA